MKKLKEFIDQSLLKNGVYDGKKFTAMIFTGLVVFIVVSHVLITYLAVCKGIVITESAKGALELMDSLVLITLVSAIMTLYGIRGYEKIAIAKTGNQNPPQQPNTEPIPQ